MTVKNPDYPYTFGTAPGSVMAEIGGSTYEPEFGPDGKHFRLKPIDHEVYADALLRVIEENADEDGALRSLTPHEAADRADIGKSRNLRNAVAVSLRDRGVVDLREGTFWLKVSDNDDQPEETVPAPAKRDPELENPTTRPAMDLVADGVQSNGRGLQAAKAWTHRLVGCRAKGTTWKVKAVGAAIREYVNAQRGTVYVSARTLMNDVGLWKEAVTDSKSVLVKRGWLTPTGDKSRTGTPVYTLTIPECFCKGCIRARKVDGETPSSA